MKDSYTLDEIRERWSRYKSISGLAVLKDGRWHYSFGQRKLENLPYAKAKIVKLMDVMEFPEFLEKYGKK